MTSPLPQVQVVTVCPPFLRIATSNDEAGKQDGNWQPKLESRQARTYGQSLGLKMRSNHRQNSTSHNRAV
ncbi:MAG: hypothetical protein SAK29_38505 [Scytonema sp. PMC 1069.18]|nr:hypothetical protein [Scytonema sp. PMC 1069.18]MEC4888319.1 hypothetical protein [Scytonema sp. PMC 1070.18]